MFCHEWRARKSIKMYFQDKVVWITGASSGIGEGLACALAKRNARLILSGRRVEELERVKKICAGDSSHSAILLLDVADLDAALTKAVLPYMIEQRIWLLLFQLQFMAV